MSTSFDWKMNKHTRDALAPCSQTVSVVSQFKLVWLRAAGTEISAAQ